MYGIFTYIYHQNYPNVGKYTIHRAFGNINHPFWGTYPYFWKHPQNTENQQSQSQLCSRDVYEVSQFITNQPGPTWPVISLTKKVTTWQRKVSNSLHSLRVQAWEALEQVQENRTKMFHPKWIRSCAMLVVSSQDCICQRSCQSFGAYVITF